MEKVLVIQLFEGVTPLARELDISTQAVSQWPDEIPEKQELKLRLRYPDIDRRLERLRRRLGRAKRGNGVSGSAQKH